MRNYTNTIPQNEGLHQDFRNKNACVRSIFKKQYLSGQWRKKDLCKYTNKTKFDLEEF